MIRRVLTRLMDGLFRPARDRAHAHRVTSWLLVGPSLQESANAELNEQGVTRILDLRAEGPDSAGILPDGIIWRRVPIVDDEAPSFEQFDQILSWATPVMNGQGAVYVHCQGGLGRGPTVAIALLMSNGFTSREATRLVSAARPGMAPTERQLDWLQELEQRSVDGEHRTASSE